MRVVISIAGFDPSGGAGTLTVSSGTKVAGDFTLTAGARDLSVIETPPGEEAAANAISITDQECRIQWINPAFTQLTGYAAASGPWAAKRLA